MMQKPILLLITSLCLHSLAHAQQSVPWGSSDKPAARQGIEGMKSYYEPDKVQRDGSVVSFTLYRSGVPTAADEVGRYKINCETREFISVVGERATPPSRIIAGEELYPIGKKLCEWDPQSFFKKLFD